MKKQISVFWLLILIFAPILIVSILVVNIYSSDYKWINDYGFNFITELIGILTTILIIDRIITSRDRKRSHELAKPFYGKIREYLENISHQLESAIKWSIEAEPKNHYNRKIIYSKEMIDNLKYLDFSQIKGGLVLYDYFYATIYTNTRDIKDLYDDFKLFLDVELQSKLFNVLEHKFASDFSIAHSNKNDSKFKKLVLKLDDDNLFKNRISIVHDFVKNYIDLVEYYEKISKEKLSVGTGYLWSNEIEPRFGAFRKE